MADVVCEEYASSLNDLTFNSKPHISMLTMLAEENIQYAPNIVRLIEAHLQKVRSEIKLPAIYLIDSIVKNVRGEYLSLFTQNLVSTFCSVFEKVDEKTRLQLYKLRQTWMDVFPNKKLYAIDVRVRQMDPAWPISAQASIHVNPKFLKSPSEEEIPTKENQEIQEAEMRKQLIAKQQELLRLQQQKLELELLQTKAKLEEQKRLLQTQPTDVDESMEEDVNLSERNVEIKPSSLTVPASVPQPIVPPVQLQSVLAKDPRQPRDPRMLRESKPFRIPTLAPPVAKFNNFPGSKAMDTQIKMEVKQSANVVKAGQMRNLCGDATKSMVNLPKDRVARNEFTKGQKIAKKDNLIPSKSSSKKKSANELKKSKTEQKKKVDIISPKKSPEIKKEIVKESPDKRKNSDKKIKSKQENREGESKSRKNNERKNASSNSGRNSSAKKDHNLKKVDSMGRRVTFRSRRNYRSNRDRSESPDKLESSASPKTNVSDSTPDLKKVVERDCGNVRGRSRSPLRKDVKHKKKLMLSESAEKIKSDGVQNDTGKENKMDSNDSLSTDVDLRHASDSPIPKNRLKGKREAKENAEGEEPPVKKTRRGTDDDEEGPLNNLFGSKDQDYRQIPQGEKSHLRGERNSWAQYKADHPDEFKKSPHPVRGNRQDFPQFRTYDMDLRMAREFENDAAQLDPNLMDSSQKTMPKFPGMRNARGMRANNDPRLSRRGFGRPMRQTNRMFDDARMLRRHPLYDRHYSEFENSHPSMNIPNALLFDRHADILRQADQQLKSGHLTREQHQELLNQLGKLYELQLTREKQREEQFRERILSQRPVDGGLPRETYPPDFENKAFYGGSNRFNISPNYPETKVKTEERVEPEQEETPARTKVSMLSIFQRENHVAVPVENNPDKISSPADDGDRFIAIDGKIMKLKYFGCVAIILEGTKAQEILFRGTRREIFVDGEIVLLGFEGDEQTFYVKEKAHTMKFGTPTHEIYIDNTPFEARFGGPAIKVLLDQEPHEIRLGDPPPDVELKELSSEMKVQVDKYLQECEEEKNNLTNDAPDVQPTSDKIDQAKEFPDVSEDKVKSTDIVEETASVDTKLPAIDPATTLPTSGEIDIEESSKDDDITKVGSPKPGTSADTQNPPTILLNTQLVDKSDPTRFSGYQESQTADDRSARDFRVKIEEKGRDSRDRNFDQDREMHDLPVSRDYHRDKGRDKWTTDQWRRGGDRLQPRDYNICNSMDTQHDRDEYWGRRDDDFARRKYYRDRGGRNASPQRNVQDYGRYGREPMRRDLPMYFPANANRMDGPRMRFDMVRQPYENRTRFDPAAWPRFDARPRGDVRHPNVRQPQFFPGGQADVRRPGFGQQFDYYSENKFSEAPTVEITPTVTQSTSSFAGPSQSSSAAPTMDIGELFKKLVAVGILPGSKGATDNADDSKVREDATITANEEVQTTAEEEEQYEQEEFDEKIPTIEFTSECLRTRFDGVIGKLCRGIQCSSCGLRFTSAQTEKYAQHLDWHFRQNRRDRDSAKKAMSRKWYYDVQDWVQFEEIEDMEERARSMFEEQAAEDTSEQLDDVQSIPVAENDEDNVCAVCGESFEQFWDQEKEEWHLRDATRIDDKTYHPICYEDIRNISLMEVAPETPVKETKTTATDWKSLEEKSEPEPKLTIEPKAEVETHIKAEPVDFEPDDAYVPAADDVPPGIASTIIKSEPQSPPDMSIDTVETRTELPAIDEGKQSSCEPLNIDGDSKCGIVPNEDEIIDNIESQSSQSIDETNVDPVVTLKKNNDEMCNVFANLVDASTVERSESAVTLIPAAEQNSEEGADLQQSSLNVSGFLVLPPVMRGTELSGLCSIM